MSYDWKSKTFALTIADAAGILEISSQAVVDLMLTGKLGFYMAADPDHQGGLPIDQARFDPADLKAFYSNDRERYASVTSPVLANLREYLRERKSLRDYDDALSQGCPIETRKGLHVRINAVVAFAREKQASPAAQMNASTHVAFERLGLLKIRNLTPFGDKQRWGTWYRLPQVIAFEGVRVIMDDFLSLKRTMADDEIEAPDGTGPVAAQDD